MKKIFKSAENGDPYAMLGLAYMYHNGKNADPDPELAMKWYIRSADSGCSRAKWELAKIFRDGSIVEADEKLHLHYLRKASDAGVPEAQMRLATYYLGRDILPYDERIAFELVYSAAEKGLPFAQFMVGYMFGMGIGTSPNLTEKEIWYSKVGYSGDADLFYRIGRSFEYGKLGLQRDLFEAGRWYKFGADMGHEKCLVCWHSVLVALDGGSVDSLQEREFKLSHTETEKEQAVRDAALAVADQFLDIGDEENAFINYQKAAELGSPVAMFTLASLYHGGGSFVKRNDRMAIDLLSKASHAGSEDAQFLMGNLYEEGGLGFKQDTDEAIKYYTQAVANGYLTALYKLGLYMEHPEEYVRKHAKIRR
ncbi:MAG: sel1 repeat family protein [Candidatus Methanoplasma sp.]|jgi:TPR repeat protein|nr:sel1 repeat family protein [Candidatus Methanoplasma sp.]